MNSGTRGHVLRSTQKDRHTKVFTAKGPRHRRVRLSALTAIRFYDLQDRLGYDRPSRAVDWLINNARFAIDKLQNPDRKTGETEHSVFNSQLKLTSVAGNFQSFFSATSSAGTVDFMGFPSGLIPSLDDPVRDLALSLHSFRDSRVIPSEEDGNRPLARNQRVATDSIPAGVWFQRPLLGNNPAAALEGRFDGSSDFRTPSRI